MFSKHMSGTLPHHGKFTSRGGVRPQRLIVHHWAGVFGGDTRLASPALDTPSANYIIYSDGRIVGQVPEEYRAWTSGSHREDAKSITVEVQNSATGEPWPIADKALEALQRLLGDLAVRYGWNLWDAATVIGHRDVYATSCPGSFLYPRLGWLRDTTRDGKHIKIDQGDRLARLAEAVLRGEYGNGQERKEKLGADYHAVQAIVDQRIDQVAAPYVKPITKVERESDTALARKVLAGAYGNGDERKRRLGARYDAVQAEVNRILREEQVQPKSIAQLAQEVIDGKHGNGDERRRSLGGLYNAVQAEVNRILGIAERVDLEALADAVERGDYGNGYERKQKLGINYEPVQAVVNRRIEWRRAA